MSDSLIIIPTYNEKENIERLLHKVFSLAHPFHVLVVEDNSPDGTADIVRSLQEMYSGRLHMIERQAKLGLGTAYIAGFNWALSRRYGYIFEMDADFSHNPDDLTRLYEACTVGGADLAIGSRYISGVNVVNWPMRRVLLSYFASVYVRWITRMAIRDTTAGFKCYTAAVLAALDFERIRFKGYAFQIEMKFAIWKMGFRICEIPIIFTDRRNGASKMNGGIFKEATLGVLAMKTKSWFRSYEKKHYGEPARVRSKGPLGKKASGAEWPASDA
jgi:dolichol-phosphate mannosyltransferase